MLVKKIKFFRYIKIICKFNCEGTSYFVLAIETTRTLFRISNGAALSLSSDRTKGQPAREKLRLVQHK